MHLKQWRDETSGRLVSQLTDAPSGVQLNYFRLAKQLPDGRMLAFASDNTSAFLMDPERGHVEQINIPAVGCEPNGTRRSFRLRKNSWECHIHSGRELWQLDLRTGAVNLLGTIPSHVPGGIYDVACDGETVIVLESEQDLTHHPMPTTMDLDVFWHYFERPRFGAIHTWNWRTGETGTCYRLEGMCPLHVEGSPIDAGLVRFCHDMYDAFGQRIWTVRTDGSDLHSICPQEWGELVTHEFWAKNASLIAYTYQDRRNDPTLREKPWAEYAPVNTQFALADLSGKEIYRSEPLNSYHTHLYLSEDATMLTGEGTDGNSFVFVAPFSMDNPVIDFQPMATIHTTYVPFRGQDVECIITADNRWLLYNDTINGLKQVCAIDLKAS